MKVKNGYQNLDWRQNARLLLMQLQAQTTALADPDQVPSALHATNARQT